MGEQITITLRQDRLETMLLYIIHHHSSDEEVAWAQEQYWRLQE